MTASPTAKCADCHAVQLPDCAIYRGDPFWKQARELWQSLEPTPEVATIQPPDSAVGLTPEAWEYGYYW